MAELKPPPGSSTSSPPLPKSGMAGAASTVANAITSTDGTATERAQDATKAVAQQAAGKAAGAAVVASTGSTALGSAADKATQVVVSDPKRAGRWVAGVAVALLGVSLLIPTLTAMMTAQAVGTIAAAAAQNANANATETMCSTSELTAADAGTTFSAQQLDAVDTITTVATSLGLPQYASVVAVATALATSDLDPAFDGGDGRIGLFGMDPAAGWGDIDDLTSATYAATAFFNGVPQTPLTGLVGNTSWQRQPVSQVARGILEVDAAAVASAEADAQRLVAAALNVTSGYSCVSNAITVDGEWFYPLPSSPLIVTSKFNPSRLNPVLHVVMPHKGADFHGALGTPIYAVLGGTVRVKANYGGAGNAVLITLADGSQMHYFHMSKFAVADGATVQAGDLIGYVGSTGNSTGPHLHFEIVIDGTAVDPVPILLEHGLEVSS